MSSRNVMPPNDEREKNSARGKPATARKREGQRSSKAVKRLAHPVLHEASVPRNECWFTCTVRCYLSTCTCTCTVPQKVKNIFFILYVRERKYYIATGYVFVCCFWYSHIHAELYVFNSCYCTLQGTRNNMAQPSRYDISLPYGWTGQTLP